MYILHGSWPMSQHMDGDRGFILWAETSAPQPGASWRGRRSVHNVPAHPLAAPAADVARVWMDLAPGRQGTIQSAAMTTAVVRLPSTPRTPLTSSDLGLEQKETMRKPKLSTWSVGTLLIPPREILGLLASLPPEDDTTPGVKVGADLRFWEVAARLALEVMAGQRVMPALVQHDDGYLGIWEPAFDEALDQPRLDRLAEAMPPVCRAVVYGGNAGDPPAPGDLLENFFAITIDALARASIDYGRWIPKPRSSVAEAWLLALQDENPQVQAAPADLRVLYEQYCAWAEQSSGVSGEDAFRLLFRLDPPPAPEESGTIVVPQAQARDWALSYFLQANDDPSLIVPAEAVWRERGSTLHFLNRRFESPQERLLAGLGQASRMFEPIEASLRSARPEECPLTAEQAYIFIREISLLLRSFGFGVMVPGLGSKLSVRLNLRPKKQKSPPKGGVAGLDFRSLIEYDWQLALGDQALSRQEFEKLASLKVPLVQVRGQWVELRPEQIEQAIRFWEKRQGAGELNLQEALRLALSLDPAGAPGGLPVAEVETQGWLADLVSQLAGGGRASTLPEPKGFQGSLRPYQSAGLGWLAFLRQWGLGACLADDMGLGKTIQVIALLLHERAVEKKARRPALLICPTSVVGNWQRELARFAPDLRVLAFHGAGRRQVDLAQEAGRNDIVISSYALLHRDEKRLNEIEWGDVILDEAQNIKNASTKSAQAARRLRAGWRAALTGTPVENRLAELWSIFQFLNPGYLGSEKDFSERFARPIERAGEPEAAGRLKALVGPFILRRVKTDPSVIDDLPPKNEIKVYCNLTREQATLYEAVVRDAMQRIDEAEGMERRGIILGMITRLKQVCNHPAQFLGDGSPLPGRSGKLARLTEMLEEVRAVRERALIFTQFAEMGEILKGYLQEMLAGEALFLHGGTPAKARDRMVERFQNDPNGPLVFILSIKAGGTGLNLMRANHVFHFDRWWNPAVENQATDRAFRIGQTRSVQVWKYLCAGTFEDKIDEMIERKKALAESIVGKSEGWITELSTGELRDLFALRREAIGDE